MTIDPSYVIERQGKSFVLYAGLLDLAHKRGLCSISTELIQYPAEENHWTTIVQATVVFRVGPPGDQQTETFSGIGDANAENVGRMIQPHSIRMAETRAKARALRDALNISAVALEELGDPEDESRPVEINRREDGVQAPRPPASGVGRNDLATPAQVRAIYMIGKDQHELDDKQIDERVYALYRKLPGDLSKAEASAMITAFKTARSGA